MTISAFAEKHHLKLVRADDTTLIIAGRYGHVYEYSESELGLLIMPAPEHTRYWGHVRRAMLAAGMTVRQDGDHEGAVSFDPSDKKAARLAMKLAGIRRRRTSSPAQLAALVKARSCISAQNIAPAGL